MTSASPPFHDVGRLFPIDVDVLSVTPQTPVPEALEKMLALRYSQVPVLEGTRLRGVFSLRSLARQIAVAPHMKPSALTVEDVMERVPIVTVDDSLHGVIQQLLQHEALLVGLPGDVQAVLTMEDALRYFYHVARAFVLIGEIELALRSLIARCAGDAIAQLIENSVGQRYKDSKCAIPSSLDELSFEEYKTLIVNKSTWSRFEPVFGRNREFVIVKLDRIRVVRNNVFHFRTEPSVLDHQDLVATRDWLLDKTQTLGGA